MNDISSVTRNDGVQLNVGDDIEFTDKGGMFEKGEKAKVLSFGDTGQFFYYVGTLAISTNDSRIKKINKCKY